MTEKLKAKIEEFERAMRKEDEPAGLTPHLRRAIKRDAASKLLPPERLRELLDKRRGIAAEEISAWRG